MNQKDNNIMSNHFLISLAKTRAGVFIMDKIHNKIYNDNNETKTNRCDESIIAVLMFMLYSNIKYDDHISILKIPNDLQYRVTIAKADIERECIYLLPDVKVYPDIIDYSYIKNLSYDEIKNLIQENIKNSK